MAIHHLRCELWLPLTPEAVFPFFADAFNLAKITPSSLGFIVKTTPPIAMHAGTVIDYTIHWLGLPLRWRTLIESFDPPRQFVDTALRGPYKRWHHTHTFVPESGGTLCGDHVEYALPFGPLGDLVHTLSVRKQVIEIFNYRQARLRELLLGDRAAEAVETLTPDAKRAPLTHSTA
jgi:ligand-binding SRPBCC domain-containing protein